jgi:hypothetical protein
MSATEPDVQVNPRGWRQLVNNTSRVGEIDAVYADLVSALGAPMDPGYEKCDAYWLILWPDGIVATVYNYKDGRRYLGDAGLPVEQIREWHIGSHPEQCEPRVVVRAVDGLIRLRRKADEPDDQSEPIDQFGRTLLNRLRSESQAYGDHRGAGGLCGEAADEIERLRSDLHNMGVGREKLRQRLSADNERLRGLNDEVNLKLGGLEGDLHLIATRHGFPNWKTYAEDLDKCLVIREIEDDNG